MKRHKAIVFFVILAQTLTTGSAQPTGLEKQRAEAEQRLAEILKQVDEKLKESDEFIRSQQAAAAQPLFQPVGTTNAPDLLRLNFRDAPVGQVLEYLRRAGLPIVLEAEPNARITLSSEQPLTKAEAVDLLIAGLEKKGYSVMRTGQTLNIVTRVEARKRTYRVPSGRTNLAGDFINTEKLPVNITAPSLRGLAAQLSGEYEEVICSESASSDTNNQTNAFSIVLDSATISEALDNLVASHREYMWRRDEVTGFINIFPSENSLLNWKVETLSFTNQTVVQIFRDTNSSGSGILNRLLMDHGVTVTANAFRRPGGWPTRGSPGHVAAVNAFLDTDTSSLDVRISMELRDVTIREAINRICAQVPSKRWDLERMGDRQGQLWFCFVRPKP